MSWSIRSLLPRVPCKCFEDHPAHLLRRLALALIPRDKFQVGLHRGGDEARPPVEVGEAVRRLQERDVRKSIRLADVVPQAPQHLLNVRTVERLHRLAGHDGVRLDRTGPRQGNPHPTAFRPAGELLAQHRGSELAFPRVPAADLRRRVVRGEEVEKFLGLEQPKRLCKGNLAAPGQDWRPFHSGWPEFPSNNQVRFKGLAHLGNRGQREFATPPLNLLKDRPHRTELPDEEKDAGCKRAFLAVDVLDRSFPAESVRGPRPQDEQLARNDHHAVPAEVNSAHPCSFQLRKALLAEIRDKKERVALWWGGDAPQHVHRLLSRFRGPEPARFDHKTIRALLPPHSDKSLPTRYPACRWRMAQPLEVGKGQRRKSNLPFLQSREEGGFRDGFLESHFSFPAQENSRIQESRLPFLIVAIFLRR